MKPIGFLCLLFLLIPTLAPAAQTQNCKEATRLVSQAYKLGHRPEVFNQQKELLIQALRLCPQHHVAHNNLASIFEVDGDFKRAMIHYQMAVKIKPDFAAGWFGVGEIYYKTARYTLSLGTYLIACRKDADANNRVDQLLRSNRYHLIKAGEFLNEDGVLLLFDKRKLDSVNELVADCGFRERIRPYFIFRNIQFEPGLSTFLPQSIRQIEAISDALRGRDDVQLAIIGPRFGTPACKTSQAANTRMATDLSKKRADALADELARTCLPRHRLYTFSADYPDPLYRDMHGLEGDDEGVTVILLQSRR